MSRIRRVAWQNHNPCLPVLNDLGQAAGRSRHHGLAHRHGLEDRDAESFRQSRVHVQVHGRQATIYRVLKSGKMDAIRDSQFFYQRPQPGLIGGISASHDQVMELRQRFQNRRQRPEHDLVPLAGK